ncbi:hypothetical protein DY000_02040821 [Brassica cretica]|uniref:Uncharacterized protein n=1 Tax=Brassica cretica TaxID=69181 RepID=A0ABQ7BMJ7_BRACR|nr:hypothetical protein DY000_02040821 [Brassica cretica]
MSSDIFSGATTHRDHTDLVPTVHNPRLLSCSSRRDKAIDTNRAAIGVRTSPHAPPEDRPSRTRETHALPSPTAVRQSHRARPPSVRRWEAAAGSLLLPHRRRR